MYPSCGATKIRPERAGEVNATLLAQLKLLDSHLDGTSLLSASQLQELHAALEVTVHLVGDNRESIERAFHTVALYDDKKSYFPFPFRRRGNDGFNVDRILVLLQQSILDRAYMPYNVQSFPDVFVGRSFESAKYFPGAIVDAVTDGVNLITPPPPALHSSSIFPFSNTSPSHPTIRKPFPRLQHGGRDVPVPWLSSLWRFREMVRTEDGRRVYPLHQPGVWRHGARWLVTRKLTLV